MSSDRFPNKAGDHADTDAILSAELTAAGIDILQYDFLRDLSGEVKASVIGRLHGWKFTRAWHYWRCEGPGIDPVTAERLHATHGNVVRVGGHCGCPSPLEWFKGFAVGSYHVDTPAGLKALADTLNEIASRVATPPTAAMQADNAGDATRLLRWLDQSEAHSLRVVHDHGLEDVDEYWGVFCFGDNDKESLMGRGSTPAHAIEDAMHNETIDISLHSQEGKGNG